MKFIHIVTPFVPFPWYFVQSKWHYKRSVFDQKTFWTLITRSHSFLCNTVCNRFRIQKLLRKMWSITPATFRNSTKMPSYRPSYHSSFVSPRWWVWEVHPSLPSHVLSGLVVWRFFSLVGVPCWLEFHPGSIILLWCAKRIVVYNRLSKYDVNCEPMVQNSKGSINLIL